jgi:TRAP-type C4-dicarboxylate transport system substrate-binding protein
VRTAKHVLILVAVVGFGSAGCSSGTGDATRPDDAPSAVTPVTLSLGTGDPRGRPDTPVVEHFAEQVDLLSDGAMQIEITWQAAGDSGGADTFEQGVVGLVQSGELDLGWIAARAWDTVDVPSFQALQAPFLITDQELLRQVLASPMSDEMLAGIEEIGLVGLGLYPDQLRYPVGYGEPLRSVDDFDGEGIRLVPSNATEALVRAFGGEPKYGLNGDAIDAAFESGEIVGTETSVGLAPEGSFLTGNLVLFPRVNTLFASADGVASLSDEQRAILEDAARATIDFAVASTTEDVEAYCSTGGQVVTASDAEVAELVRAARPVLDTMQADPRTATFIDQIEAMKDGAPVAVAPTTCDRS